MRHVTMTMFSVAMTALTLVSMWTTYVSLADSILPGPLVPIPYAEGESVSIAVPALALSVGIGMMLLGMKFAVINERRNLGVVGFIGLFVIAFISISFNLDVLYRVAHKDFMVNHADQQMRATYENYLSEVQTVLSERELDLKRHVARQEGELESEIQGLREAPAGFGERAKAEQYELNLMQRESEVELETIQEAIAKKDEANTLLSASLPETTDDVLILEKQIRVLVKDAGAVAGIPMPAPAEIEMPIFAVFSRLFDSETVGFKEVFYLLIAMFLDLGDIVGYNLVARKGSRQSSSGGSGGMAAPIPGLSQEMLPPPASDSDEDSRAVSRTALEPNRPRGARALAFNRGWSVYRR